MAVSIFLFSERYLSSEQITTIRFQMDHVSPSDIKKSTKIYLKLKLFFVFFTFRIE